MVTKKEQKQFDDLVHKLRISTAFRWTSSVVRDIEVPKSGFTENGYDYNAWLGGHRVEKACTSMCFHSFGNWSKTTTQGGRALFSTRLLALKGMRNELERVYAEELAKVDKEIEDEEAL